MKTIVRVSPGTSTSGLHPFFKDKKPMVLSCQRSFLKAGGYDITYLLDNCPDDWEREFAPYGEVIRGVWGKKESLYKACEIGLKMDDDILFLEDDYLWRPRTVTSLMYGLVRFGFVSPYDHPDFYSPDEPTATQVYKVGQVLWRRCPTNTHTFAVRRDILHKYFDIISANQFDWLMYTRLAVEGIPCFCPIPSFATHLNLGRLGLGIDWEEIIDK